MQDPTSLTPNAYSTCQTDNDQGIFLPSEEITSCMIHPLPIQQFLVVASFILCLIQLSTLRQLKVYPFWKLLLLLSWLPTCRFYYILFNLFDDWHFPFPFFQIILVTSFQLFVNLWRHYYAILFLKFFIIWMIKLLYTCTYMYKYSPCIPILIILSIEILKSSLTWIF